MKLLIASLTLLVTSASSYALSCHGTEPFWSAEISENNLSFDQFTYPSVSYDVTKVSPANGFSSDYIQVYSDDRGPLAVVKSDKCSDGMNDADFPKEIIIFTGSGTYFGCCGEGTPTQP
ncbi:hypothetical protein GW916_08480 [bacterium]|nr:hypothetical protein [bacterium]